MSLLFGALGLGGGLSELDSDRLMRAMRERAAASVGAVSETQAATVDGLALALCVHKRSSGAISSSIARRGHLTLALRGRIEDRSGLLRRLGLAKHAALTDSQLLLAARLQEGPDFIQQLSGEWSFALWDSSSQRLLLARDATGNSPLFWWRDGGRIVFASSLPTLLAAPVVPTRPDPHWLAGLLTVFQDPARPGATAFEAVRAVPPGHLLVADQSGQKLQRWWLPEKMPLLESLPLSEIDARFTSLYSAAVRTALHRSEHGGVAIALSGGLDSGSLAALAAPMLASHSERLSAYVHTPRYRHEDPARARTLDEWPLAQATARFVGNIDTVACSSAQVSPIDGIRRWHDLAGAPSHGAANCYWLIDIAQQAAAGGASVLLNGQAGNSTVSFEGTGDIRELLRRAGLAAAWRELSSDLAGWPGALRDRLVKPLFRPGLDGWRRTRIAMSRRPGWYDFALIGQGLADGLKLNAAMRDAGHDPALRIQSERRTQLFRLSLLGGADNGQAAWSELGLAHGLTVRDPTRDRRLVEFCWSLPDNVFWANGRRRGLVRRALVDRLPQEVLECRRKGLQSSDLRLRLQACRDDFLQQVYEVCRHPIAREWIDTERLAAAAASIDRQSPPLPPGGIDLAHVMRALAAGMFIVRWA